MGFRSLGDFVFVVRTTQQKQTTEYVFVNEWMKNLHSAHLTLWVSVLGLCYLRFRLVVCWPASDGRCNLLRAVVAFVSCMAPVCQWTHTGSDLNGLGPDFLNCYYFTLIVHFSVNIFNEILVSFFVHVQQFYMLFYNM